MTSRPRSRCCGLAGEEAQRGVALEHRLGRPAERLHLEPVVHHRQRRHAAVVGGASHLGEGGAQLLGASGPAEVRAVDRPASWVLLPGTGILERVDLRTYRFSSSFTLEAPRKRVHEVLVDLEFYSEWWPQVRAVAKIDDDHALVVCRSTLPYDLELELSCGQPRPGLPGGGHRRPDPRVGEVSPRRAEPRHDLAAVRAGGARRGSDVRAGVVRRQAAAGVEPPPDDAGCRAGPAGESFSRVRRSPRRSRAPGRCAGPARCR